MNEPEAPNPLFDPLSTYSRFRRPMMPLEKIRGYFLELAERARKVRAERSHPDEGALAGLKPSEPSERVRHAESELEVVWDGGNGGASGPEVHILAARSGLPLTASLAAEPGKYDPSTETTLFSVKLSGLTWPGDEAVCRLFVVAPVVKEKLLALVPAQQPAEKSLNDVFAPKRLAGDPTLARLLSAVPDVDGWIAPDGRLIMPSVELPAGCFEIRRLPKGTAVVLVIDTRGD
ncbi:hypothetical protein [Frigoriglobus tundricola]|uniref:Uncharacterized protein n=1 Tax=Frigoriglobus tundricola TaxID=2774151 RepID=A0A6M5YWW8_9BACT|nr:hypothetical protein [Frigoriglobus tundricola]QJW98505.1 hypothetical protein FTUN_6095 [Frigoriglobus tundricola]